MAKNIFLCDANFCTLPILQAVKKRGYNLTTIGSITKDPGHLLADSSLNIDYSDTELLYKSLTGANYQGIVPGCNDRSYLSSAFIAEKLGFPGFDSYETVLTIHYKDRFRLYAEQQGYPVPKAILSDKNLDSLKFPVLVKPVDSFSGKGINKAYTNAELESLCQEAKQYSRSGSVLIEEFVEGKLYSHSAFIKNQKIITDFFVNEYCTVYPYQVNSSNVATLLSDKVKEGLRTWTEQFATDLDLCDGLIHTQFISDNTDYYLIEVARRCPGDLYSQLIQKTTGIDYADLYALPFCGLELPDTVQGGEIKFVSRHTASVDEDCIFIGSSLNIDDTLVQNVQLKYSGELMKAAPFDKSGIYFIEHATAKKMEELTEQLKDYLFIETLELC